MVYWDLHGVLADLSRTVFGFEPLSWDYKINNENLLDKIEADLSLLEKCEPTEYISLAQTMPFVFIISSQPAHWRERSNNWLRKFFNPNRVYVRYVNTPQEKLGYLKENDRLVEDYPFFSAEEYNKIILINREYNKEAPAKIRVSSPEELREYVFNG
jgi:hypothetical protein